ncbi:hypothetical protein LOD99_10272 [Oopsacas minuta]|uniref:Uncharacterized protein n=1 Tax=Oopsacas minuta TaxID=111878 RepID=A0AAV7KIN1_9METZ|nr:hypothetical protein LOD99_10272 [Oopsacas minuta]
MEDGDVLANATTKKIMSKLRDMVVHNIVLKEQVTGVINQGIPDMMRMNATKIRCSKFRFLPVNQQPWLLGQDEIDVLRINSSDLRMREGSALRNQDWSIVLFVYREVHNKLAKIQEKATEIWERAYMAKAPKDERRKAAYIFADVNIL